MSIDTNDGNVIFDLIDCANRRHTCAEASNFLREKFVAKECTNFRTKKRQKIYVLDDFIDHCFCGGTFNDHDKTLINTTAGERWSEDDIIKISTNAFGKITFTGTDNFQKPAKYVRLAEDSQVADVITLLEDHWKLTNIKPELVISIMGSAKTFNLTDSIKQKIFNRGLIPAIEATRGWITTFGSNMGVAKAVGDAVREGQFLWEENGQVRRSIQCIGIAPWGSIRDRELLMNSAESLENKLMNEVDYSADSMVRHGKATSLNPYHTHFLLVDNGHRNEGWGAESFRASLEQKIATPERDGGLNIPVVVILIGGGETSIENVLQSVSRGLPVLVCEGSGRAADIIAYAYRRYRLYKYDDKGLSADREKDNLRFELNKKLERVLFNEEHHKPSRIEKLIYKLTEEIMQICQHTNLVYVFDVTRSESLDTAILLCLLECKSLLDMGYRHQLHLALHWNRADVAKAKIFNSDTRWTNEDLHGHFTEALIDNKIDFIKLFVDHGFSVKRYLTVSKLREIYSLSVDNTTYMWHLLKYDSNGTKQSGGFYLIELYNLLQGLTRRFTKPTYMNDTSDSGKDLHTFDKPFQELFLWATLLNRNDMALYFWEQCAEPLSVILSGTYVCRCLALEAENFITEIFQQYDCMKNVYEANAVALINQAYDCNKEKALSLIKMKPQIWGKVDMMELAALSSDQSFLATSCCQTAIFRTWRKGYEATGMEIVLSTFTVIPVLYLIEFTDETAQYSRSTRDATNFYYANKARMCDFNDFHSYQRPESYQRGFYAKRKSSPSVPAASKFAVIPPQMPRKSIIPYDTVDEFPRKKLRWWQKIITFYTSPVVKFVGYVIATYPATTFLNKFEDWWYYSSFAIWNRLELFCIFISLLIFILRWFAATFVIARLLLAWNFIVYMFRIYKIFMVNSYLGPKVVMIKRMSRDLAMFLLIVMVLMISYSVASQALLHPHRTFYTGIFYDIFNHGIWELFGELNDEITQGNLPECNSAINETLFGLTNDCSFRIWPAAILLAVYLFFGNILLVNMLIAIFASVFDDVQSHAEQIWKSLMYFLVNEYANKPVLPPPFIVFVHIFDIFRTFWKLIRKKEYTSVNVDKSLNDRYKFLNVFELVCRSDFLEKQRQADRNIVEEQLSRLNENVQKVLHLLPELASGALKVDIPRPMAMMERKFAISVPADLPDFAGASLRPAAEVEVDDSSNEQEDSIDGILFH